MGRPPATAESEARVQRLLTELFAAVERNERSIAAIASDANLGHETVRRLWRNPGGHARTGPGFFIVEAIARAERISLDHLAATIRSEQ